MSSRHLFIPLLLLLLVTGIQGLFDHEGLKEEKSPISQMGEVVPVEESTVSSADEEDLAANERQGVIDAPPVSRASINKPSQDSSDERGSE